MDGMILLYFIRYHTYCTGNTCTQKQGGMPWIAHSLRVPFHPASPCQLLPPGYMT
jgi:hypothetical protein